ncbi:hypothetical protein SPHINGOT1_340037 [Sphingomonas sp. T1]|nr:hypothetical protein SPHINGOT1_340037 [Sphingomonas sp. T1]
MARGTQGEPAVRRQQGSHFVKISSRPDFPETAYHLRRSGKATSRYDRRAITAPELHEGQLGDIMRPARKRTSRKAGKKPRRATQVGLRPLCRHDSRLPSRSPGHRLCRSLRF